MRAMKLQMVCCDEFDNDYFTDFYCDADKIESFYISKEGEIDGKVEQMINIFISGECFSVKQEAHITDYLTERFITNLTV